MNAKPMIGISVRQPWAELIIQNKKTIEVRKSRTKHRGLLVIQAGGLIYPSEFIKANINRKEFSPFYRKAIIGVVTLIDIVKLNEGLWEEYREKHLIPGVWRFEDHKYAWILENPIRIKPIPYRGIPRYFEINEESTRKIIKALSKLEAK